VNALKYPIYYINVLIYKAYFSLLGFIRRGRKKLFIYTDSRGYDVNDWRSKKNPRSSYIMKLLQRQNVTAKICEYKHTTLLDFIDDIRSVNCSSYDCLVLHVGVVDFSPRPLVSALKLRELKLEKVARCFGDNAVQEFSLAKHAEMYRGEETASLYSTDFLEKYIIPFINNLNVKVIWLPVNEVLSSWSGNYAGVRPVNMNVILQYQQVIDSNAYGCVVPRIINREQDVKCLTVDNIHFSKAGMSEIFRIISDELGEK
tara:strand:- start:6185 stop:6958 length:774 start_codon:yes stop_codon:yes gene_type:complete